MNSTVAAALALIWTGVRVILFASIIAVLCIARREKRQATLEVAMGQARHRKIGALGSLCGLVLFMSPQAAFADAGGASFWLPGIFGSLAAVPGMPGWAYSTIYVHESELAGASQNFVLGGRAVGSVVAGLNAHADVVAQGFTYVSPMSVLGGQAAFSIVGAGGNVGVGIDATLTGPRGNSISGSATDNRNTFTDVFYQGSLKWNQGVNNEMVYITGNIPSGTYDPTRPANLSSGYVAVDAGVGYTYFDTKTGHEFSVVGGLTYDAALFAEDRISSRFLDAATRAKDELGGRSWHEAANSGCPQFGRYQGKSGRRTDSPI